MREYSEAQILAWHAMVGQKVIKRSGKPFKSGNKVGTVQCVSAHDHTTYLAFRMVEDGSLVECFRCKLVPSAGEGVKSPHLDQGLTEKILGRYGE